MTSIIDIVKIKKIKELHKDDQKDPYRKPLEVCVVCGAVTDIPADTPIRERKWYVPGGGQLCRKCCMELYETDDLRSL